MRTIHYAIQKSDGLVISRVGNEVAIPVLQFEKIGQGGHGFEKGDFRGPTLYELEKFPVLDLRHSWSDYRWTKKIPVPLKNRHREFWGMKPLKTPTTQPSPSRS